MSDLKRVMDAVGEWLASGGALVFLTDFDGTLAPIVDDPAEAAMPPGARRHLRQLSESPRAKAAVISGRDLGDLRRRVGVPGVVYAGCHGLEIVGGGLTFSHPEAVAQEEALAAIARELSRRAEGVPGMRVEPKRFAVAVHYRHVPADELRRVEMELARAIQRHGGRLRVFRGIKVIEVLPQAAWNKGDCARLIRDWASRALPPPSMTVYVGDEWTDEHAFEALAGQAMTVRVGDRAAVSRASYHLEGVDEVHELLAAAAAHLDGGATP